MPTFERAKTQLCHHYQPILIIFHLPKDQRLDLTVDDLCMRSSAVVSCLKKCVAALQENNKSDMYSSTGLMFIITLSENSKKDNISY